MKLLRAALLVAAAVVGLATAADDYDPASVRQGFIRVALEGAAAETEGQADQVEVQANNNLAIFTFRWAGTRAAQNRNIPSCKYCKTQVKGFLKCASKNNYPTNTPFNWDASACLPQWSGLANCTNWEVGYALLQGADNGNAGAIVYGTAQGGCKSLVNYWAPVTRGVAAAKPPHLQAYGCKQCTAYYNKVLKCALETSTAVVGFTDTVLGCILSDTASIDQFLSCGGFFVSAALGTASATDIYLIEARAQTAPVNPFLVCPSAQAFVEGGQAGIALPKDKRKIISGKLEGGIGTLYANC